MSDDGFDITNKAGQLLPLGLKAASASMRVLTDPTMDAIPCVFLDLGPDGSDEITAALVLSVQEAAWLMTHIPQLIKALGDHLANTEAEVNAFRAELDG